MVETANEPSLVGNTITDEHRIVYLLAIYQNLSIHWLINSSVPAMEIVIERLIHEHRKLKDCGALNKSVSDRALAARKRNGITSLKCYGCQ